MLILGHLLFFFNTTFICTNKFSQHQHLRASVLSLDGLNQTLRPLFVNGQSSTFNFRSMLHFDEAKIHESMVKTTVKSFLPRQNTCFIWTVNDRHCFSMPAESNLLLDICILLSRYSCASVDYVLIEESFT